MDYKEQIVVKESELLGAMKNSDLNKMKELLHEDLLFTIPSGETFTKQMDLESYRSGAMKVSKISSNNQQINIIGDNLHEG